MIDQTLIGQILLQSGPEVDRPVGIKTRPSPDPSIALDDIPAPRKEPICDLTPKTERSRPTLMVARFNWAALFFSTTSHLIAFLLFGTILSNVDMRILQPESETPIEISFGLDIDAPPVAANHQEQEATKTVQTLPQLPKLIAPSAAEVPPDTLPIPAQPTPKPQKTPLVTMKNTPPPEVRTLSPQELLKRAEMERRRIDKKEQSGINTIPRSPFDKIPTNPAPATNKNLPPDPTAMLRRGDLQGSFAVSAQSDYAVSALQHIRKYWQTPDLVQFDPSIQFIVSFDVNAFGKIIGALSIVKSSGVKGFDDAAVAAIKDANPFPDLPKELGSIQRLKLRFTPREVK